MYIHNFADYVDMFFSFFQILFLVNSWLLLVMSSGEWGYD
jgi:hypothetical protein